MRLHRLGLSVALLLLAQTLGTGCILFPQLKDKVVDLVTGGSVTTTWPARGIIDVYSDSQTLNLRDSIDVAKVLKDAGIDVADVKSITLSGVAYRITKADSTAGREITNGTVTVTRAGGAAASLISNFNAKADAITGWITTIPDPAGVTQLDNLLNDILAELQGGPAANEVITYHVDGQSQPIGVNSNFDYQLRLTISIVGKIKVKTIE